MKMKVIDRIMLAMYAILGILSLAVLGACVLWPEIYALNFSSIMMNRCGTQTGKIVGCALIVVLISGLIHLIALAFRKEVRGPKSSVSVQNTDSGAVRVSVQAMDALVRRAIGNQEGVLGVKSKIVNHDDSITVHIDMALAMDSHIPNITMMMQRRIKRYIEETSGIAVREVVVLVSEVREGAPTAIAAPVEAESPAETESAEEALPEEAASEEMISEEPVGEETISEETVSEETISEEVVSEEAVSEEADSEETFPEEEADGEEVEYHEFSEDDELIAMEEAAEMEEAAVLEEVLAVEPDGEADDGEEANRAAGETVKSTADDAE